jgi:endonuclease YncB( thermonuclease family)
MWLDGARLILVALALNAGSPTTASVQAVIDPVRLDVITDDGETQGIRLIGVASDDLCNTDTTSTRTHALVDAQSLSIQLASDSAQPDADGRLPAYVWLSGGENLGELLVKEGDVAANRGETHPLADAFAAAQADARARHVGIWAPGACPALATLPGFIDNSTSAIQRARTAISILHDQARSAPLTGSSRAWQSTTATSIDWLRSSASQLRDTPSIASASSVSDVQVSLAQLGADLGVQADAYAQGASVLDVGQLQQTAERLDADGEELTQNFARLAALSATYGAGD